MFIIFVIKNNKRLLIYDIKDNKRLHICNIRSYRIVCVL